jgi:type II secretory pathway component PulF
MSVAPPPSRSLLAWLGPALVHATLVGAILSRIVWAGPRCQKFVDEMNMKLPALTQAVLVVSVWVNKYWYVVLIALVPALAANALLLWLLSRQSPAPARRWFLVAGILLCLAWAVLEAGYFLPILKLYEGLRR